MVWRSEGGASLMGSQAKAGIGRLCCYLVFQIRKGCMSDFFALKLRYFRSCLLPHSPLARICNYRSLLSLSTSLQRRASPGKGAVCFQCMRRGSKLVRSPHNYSMVLSEHTLIKVRVHTGDVLGFFWKPNLKIVEQKLNLCAKYIQRAQGKKNSVALFRFTTNLQ